MKKLAFAVAASLIAAPAFAHTGHGAAEGLLQGLVHPMLGLDHLLAMLAVGLWSGFVLPRHVWAGGALFLAAMTAGAALSWSGIGLPMVEGWITLSVAVFGGLTLLSRQGQAPALTAASFAAIAGFALAHGHAHATEATGPAAPYLAGFLVATAALHLTGIVLARMVAKRRAAGFAQGAMGAGIALGGLLLMAG